MIVMEDMYREKIAEIIPVHRLKPIVDKWNYKYVYAPYKYNLFQFIENELDIKLLEYQKQFLNSLIDIDKIEI